MVKYELDKIVNEVVKLCEEFPDAKYHAQKDANKPCLYTMGEAGNGKCGCVVGQGIINAYPELEETLKDIDFADSNPSADQLIESCCGIKDTIATHQKLMLMWNIQQHQDSGLPWGEALKLAKETVGL